MAQMERISEIGWFATEACIENLGNIHTKERGIIPIKKRSKNV